MGRYEQLKRALTKCTLCGGTGRQAAYHEASSLLDRNGRPVQGPYVRSTAYKRCTGCHGTGQRR